MHLTTNALPQLLGKKIQSLWVGKSQGFNEDDDENLLKFIDTNKEEYLYFLNAECCSQSFFDKAIELKYVLGREIISIVLLESVPDDRATKQSDDLVTYIVIQTKHIYGGISAGLITFRNSSNGCYSGDISYCEPTHPFLKTLDKVVWRQIAGCSDNN